MNGRKIRVAYFTHYADLYGANRSLLDLVVELRDRGLVEPFVICAAEGPLTDRLKQLGIDQAIVPFSMWMAKRVYMGRPHHRLVQWLGYRKASRERLRKDKALVPRLAQLIRERRIEVLHVNSSVIGIGHLLQQKLKLPLVWHVRELVFKHYGLHPDVGFSGFRRALLKADRVIAISDAVKQELGGLKNCVVIHNGIISDEAYRQRMDRKPRFAGDPFTFTLIGYFHKSKGQIEAIEAFAEVKERAPQVKLLIAGSGNAKEIRARVDSLGIANAVEFAGFVNDPDRLYERTDVLLNCSRHEALGRVTIEAMFHRVPVIGHASGATPELIQHGRTGFLYHTPEELAAAMMRMLQQPQLRSEMGEEAFRTLGDRFSVQARSQDVHRLYMELV